MLHLMQRHGKRLFLPVVMLILWVAFITFTGELTMLTSSSKKSRLPLHHTKAPTVTPFAKLAEDRLWRNRLLNHILSTVKGANKTNNVSEAGSVGSRKKLKPNVTEITKKSGTRVGFQNYSSTEIKVLRNHMKGANNSRKTIDDQTRGITKVKTTVERHNMSHIPSGSKLGSPAGVKVKHRHTSRLKLPDKTGEIVATRANVSAADSNNKLLKLLNNSSPPNDKLSSALNKTSVALNGTIGHLNEPNIFNVDDVPTLYRNTVIANETIHLCVVAAGKQIAKELEILVKSILVHARRSDIMFHFVTDNEPHEHIAEIFEDFDHPFVNIAYEIVKTDLKQYLHKQLGNKVEITSPWAGIYGAGKIFLYDLLLDVTECIVVDTDVVFATDPAFLWKELQSKLQPPVAIGVTMAKGDKYFNSGLMLQNFELLRNISFGKMISMDVCRKDAQNKSDTKFKCLHDQILLNSVMESHPNLFDNTLTVSWNLGLCYKFRNFTFASFEDKSLDLFFGAAHFSCISLEYSNAIEGFKRIPKWYNLQKYVHYLEMTNFKNEKWKEYVV